MSLGKGEAELTEYVTIKSGNQENVSSPIFNAYILPILFKYYPGYLDTIPCPL